MSQEDHWEEIYGAKKAGEMGWFKPHLRTSLDWIKNLELSPATRIIDIGAGTSTLADDLLELGFGSITLLDISQRALSSVRRRLGQKVELLEYLVGDISSIDLPKNSYGLWHDRAVFHFLTEDAQQQRYMRRLRSALKPGGHVIMGTFAPEAPSRCSGLPVRRYRREALQAVFGEEFTLVRQHKELHITPGGVEQMYLYCQFSRKGSDLAD